MESKEKAITASELTTDPNINTITVVIVNNTTSPLTLNNLNPLPSTSGNPVVISGQNSSAGTSGNGYFIPMGATVQAFQHSGGCYEDPNTYNNDYPAASGSIVYNVSDGIITINWNYYQGVDTDTAVYAVPSTGSQFEGIPVYNGNSQFTVTIQSRV